MLDTPKKLPKATDPELPNQSQEVPDDMGKLAKCRREINKPGL
jgi:hypothetical protein